MAQTITVVLSAVDQYSGQLASFKTDIQETGQAVQQQGSAFSGLTSAVGGMIAAYAGLKGIQMVGEMVATGQEVNRTRAMFDSLTASIGGSANIMARLRSATDGTVTDTTLMGEATKVLSLNVASSADELQRMTQMADNLTDAVGGDGATALERFGTILSTGRLSGLKEFGINVEDVRKKMDDLKKSGMDAQDALKAAVFDEGAAALKRFGSAVDAADTPIMKLQTTWKNFWDDFDSRLATGVNGLLGMAEVITNPNAQLNGQTGGQSYQVSAADYAKMIAAGTSAPMAFGQQSPDTQIAALNKQYQSVLAEAAKDPVTAYWDAYTNEWMKRKAQTEADATQKSAMMAGYIVPPDSAWAQIARDNAEKMSIANANEMNLRNAAQSSLGAYNTSAGSFLASNSTIGKYMDADNAKRYADELTQVNASFEYMKSLSQQGLISDDQLNQAQTYRDRVADIAAQAAQAANNLKNMKLSDVFGQQSGGILGQMSDQVIAQMRASGASDKDITAAQQKFNLASGKDTQSSQYFQNQIVPMLANMNPDQAAKAMTNLQTFMQAATTQGLSQAQITQGMQMVTGAGGAGGQAFTVKPGDTLSAISAQTGIPVSQLLAGTGAGSASKVQPGTYSAGGLSATMPAVDPMQAIQVLLSGGLRGGEGQGGGSMGMSGGDWGGAGKTGAAFGSGGTGKGGGAAELADNFKTMKTNADGVVSSVSSMNAGISSAVTQSGAIARNLMQIPSNLPVRISLGVDDPQGIIPILQAIGAGAGLAGIIQANGGNTPGAPAGTGGKSGTGGKPQTVSSG